MTAPPLYFFELVKTRLGSAAIVWSEDGRGPRVVRIGLPAPERQTIREIRILFPKATEGSCGAVATLARGIRGILAGKPVPFDATVLDRDRLTPFERKVLAALAAVPRGKVIPYGRLAARTGAPGAARAAGRGCAKNPFPLLFPCHRVVRSDGSPGGFSGGLALKRALLEMEGVRFDKTGKVLPEYVIA
ncbi:MAG TPA: methylated-DNA--[protein]-cysteine S-methyltransferase [Syntrophales bacterium]|nr:methylated-DNA--[protein]-cysteine S-methyltransferase [Syntrophales bacterium]